MDMVRKRIMGNELNTTIVMATKMTEGPVTFFEDRSV